MTSKADQTLTNVSQSPKKLLILLLVLFPIFLVIAGYLYFSPRSYITVSGTSENVRTNEVATFYVDVSSTNELKETAVSEMTANLDQVVLAVKEFGIAEEDLKTNYFNVYQEQKWDPDTQESSLGDWIANSSLEITLKDVALASSLSDLLVGLNTASVNGPNFVIMDVNTDEGALLAIALEDAREKADVVAEASGMKIIGIKSFSEGYMSSPEPMLARMDIGMGGAEGIPFEPGSSTERMTVTVTYVAR